MRVEASSARTLSANVPRCPGELQQKPGVEKVKACRARELLPEQGGLPGLPGSPEEGGLAGREFHPERAPIHDYFGVYSEIVRLVSEYTPNWIGPDASGR